MLLFLFSIYINVTLNFGDLCFVISMSAFMNGFEIRFLRAGCLQGN